MDEQPPEYSNARFHGLARTLEPGGARTSSRWSPKPEQILILESIFNSGMTNPPKDETVRIRKMLQEFGSVGDANVFYWFQNRRSRLRRQQRHALHAHNIIMMSNMTKSMSDVDGSGGGNGIVDSTSAGGGSAGDHICSVAPDRLISLGASSSAPHPHPHPVGIINHQLSSSSTSPQMKETMEHSHEDALGFGLFYHDHASFMDSYQRAAGHVIVLINEFPTEVPSGPFDTKAMFGEDLMLIHHPSGLPLPCDSHGIIILQPGESYFLVQKPN